MGQRHGGREREREKAMGQRDAARVRERKKDMGPRHEREGGKDKDMQRKGERCGRDIGERE